MVKKDDEVEIYNRERVLWFRKMRRGDAMRDIMRTLRQEMRSTSPHDMLTLRR